MRYRTSELSEFGKYLLKLCERSGQSVYEVGLKAGLKTESRITYALRPYGGKMRSTKLGFEQLKTLAGELMATEDERSLLILLGLKEHLPKEIRKYLENIERDVRSLRRQLGLPDRMPRIG